MSELSRKLDYAERAALPTVAELELNADGSLVQLDAGDWFVCFVPGIDKQWWHPFVHHRHKHVFALRPAENCKWTLFEPWWTRLLTATISNEQAEKFLRWGALGDVLLVREAIPGGGGQARGWMNCAALAAYLLGRPYGCGHRTRYTAGCCASRMSVMSMSPSCCAAICRSLKRWDRAP